MPDIGDGEAVAVEAQKKGIKVIVYSGTLNDLSADVRANCLGVYEKPLEAVEIADAINSLFKI